MSIKFTSEAGWVISHPDYFSQIETKVEGKTELYALNPNLFEIQDQFKKSKRPENKDLSEISKVVLDLSKKLLLPMLFRTKSQPICDKTEDNDNVDKLKKCPTLVGQSLKRRNADAVMTAKTFYDQNCNFPFVKFHGQNPLPWGIFSPVTGIDCPPNEFLFPAQSRFFSGDLTDMGFAGEAYDLIVMDPPWRNKFIRRRKKSLTPAGYQLMDSVEISSLPIDTILEEDGLLVVWCTNNKSHQDKLLQDFFPKWGLELVTIWFWLKVTIYGELICPLAKDGIKQPYETVIIGRKKNSGINKDRDSSISKYLSRNPQQIRLIVSTPSAINSHKPPLTTILESYFGKTFENKCELFARYLMTDFTSYGNQVVKLMHRGLFLPVTDAHHVQVSTESRPF